MARATVYSIVLAPELRDAFLAAAAASERPPAQVLRGLMRDFIQRQQEGDNGDAGSESSAPGADFASTDSITAGMDSAIAGTGVAAIAEAVTDPVLPANELAGAEKEASEATSA